MSGQTGARGYLIQTLICVLDSIEDTKWQCFSIEPDSLSDKVDVIWYYDNFTKVVQIKHSQNQINLPDVTKWASELEKSIQAENYELKLIGPCSDSVASKQSHGKVSIPTPLALNLVQLIEQAAHKLDKYLESKNLKIKITSTQRESLVKVIITEYFVNSTKGHRLSRDAFDNLIIKEAKAFVEKRETVNSTIEEAEKLIKDIEQFLLEAYKQQEVIMSERLRKERVASPQERDKLWNDHITSSISLGERAMIEYKVKFKDKVIKMRDRVLSELENNTKEIDQITLTFYQNPANLNIVQEILSNLEEITSKLKSY